MLPVPPFVEVTLPVVLILEPLVVAITSTVIVHDPLAAIVPPLKLTVVLPAAGANVGAPQPAVVAFGVAATSMPAGNASVKATPVRAVPVFGFVIVNVSVLTPPTTIGFGENAFAIEGGATTLMLADAVPPVPPSVEVTLPVVLFCEPAAVPVTFTENVHELLAAKLAPERLMMLVACVAVIVPPPHVPVRPFGVAMVKPAGNVSLNATPFNTVVVLLF